MGERTTRNAVLCKVALEFGILWSWRWLDLLSGSSYAPAHAYFIFFAGVEGWESWGYGFLDPQHHINSMDALDFLPTSPLSATHLREKTDRIYTLVTITAFSIWWST
jgi:hypothetical protein